MELHILLLSDRDWTHPRGGARGTNLYGQVSRWLAWGHRVTVICGGYPGCQPVEQLADGLVIHRMGSRLTVFPRAAWATWRGVGRDADVVLEVVSGIAFFTPFWRWLRVPRVALVHPSPHAHELGARGRIAAFLFERFPLRYIYRLRPVLTVSNFARDRLIELGIAPERIHVAYPGLEPAQFRRGPRDPRPTLLHVGRLKAHERPQILLDVLAAIPEATLEIIGDGDHRATLEQQMAKRGLAERVVLHGHLAQDARAEVYARAWVNLTASSPEGWDAPVMEAAACGTPSAGLAVGALPEAIVDGQTGVLAETPAELCDRVRDLVADPVHRDGLGAAAEARARGFTWEQTAQANLKVLQDTAGGGHLRLRNLARESESGKAAGLAGATLANNAMQLAFTVVFVRLLGTDGYGSLAALVSAFLILLIGGQSIQAAAARELTLGHLGSNAQASVTLRVWTLRLLGLLVLVSVASAFARVPISHLVGVPDHPWAAAAILPAGALWMLLSLQRGALQGMRAFHPLGVSLVVEAGLRIAFGLLLVGVGLGVTGAFLGTPLAFAGTSLSLAIVLHKRLAVVPGIPHSGVTRTLRSLIGKQWRPVTGLLCLGLLQNVDVIMGKHTLGGDRAGSYAAAAVAAKSVLWVAIGLGLHLLPEATRRGAAGLDPKPVLYRAFGMLAVIAAPAMAIFILFPHLLLRIAFGPDATQASSELALLGAAMTLLAVAYLTVLYMIALGQSQFLWVLGVVALAEPFLLGARDFSLLSFAAIVLGVQCLAASGVLALGLRARFRTASSPDLA